jgi:hypothetical protein
MKGFFGMSNLHGSLSNGKVRKRSWAMPWCWKYISQTVQPRVEKFQNVLALGQEKETTNDSPVHRSHGVLQ